MFSAPFAEQHSSGTRSLMDRTRQECRIGVALRLYTTHVPLGARVLSGHGRRVCAAGVVMEGAAVADAGLGASVTMTSVSKVALLGTVVVGGDVVVETFASALAFSASTWAMPAAIAASCAAFFASSTSLIKTCSSGFSVVSTASGSGLSVTTVMTCTAFPATSACSSSVIPACCAAAMAVDPAHSARDSGCVPFALQAVFTASARHSVIWPSGRPMDRSAEKAALLDAAGIATVCSDFAA
mmetsp:Transcript_24299/g.57560  ORF Transcript_24299/g.57560 Transcript_24299/m.57560 type:complete len:241 (-) Transcript_24299:85-807(-)